MRTAVQAALVFSLLVGFSTSASAALCLQMDHQSPGTGATGPLAAAALHPLKEPASAKGCCHQQSTTPTAVLELQRRVGLEQNPALSTPAVGSVAKDSGELPPGIFDPALEKRSDLTPSLVALSISRT